MNDQDQELLEDLNELIAQMNPDHPMWRRDPARWRTLVSDDVRSLLPRVAERFRELASGLGVEVPTRVARSPCLECRSRDGEFHHPYCKTGYPDVPLAAGCNVEIGNNSAPPIVRRNYIVPADFQRSNAIVRVTPEIPPGIPLALVAGSILAQDASRWCVMGVDPIQRTGDDLAPRTEGQDGRVLLVPYDPARLIILGVPLIIVE
jgi:hypothetical protein